MIDKASVTLHPLNEYLEEYKELNTDNEFRPVAVGRYGIRTRESIYSKELAKDYSKNKLIHKGTLTVGMGSVQMDIGILSDDETYSVSPAYHTYKIKEIDYDYLRYCLQCRNMDMFTRFMKRGSRQGKSIDLKRWIDYEIPVYPSDEQTEIVKNLKHVENIIQSRENELMQLEDLIKARFVEMFEECKNEVLIGDVISICRGASPRPIKAFITNDEDAVNWIKIGDVSENSLYITQTAEKITQEGAKKSRLVHKGDFILSNSMSFGRPYILGIDGCVHDGWLILSDFRETFDELYLYHALRSEHVQLQFSGKVNGATVKNLNSDLVKATYIQVPDMKAQKQFAEFVRQVDKSKVAVQKALNETQLLFDSMMQEYFG